MIITEESFGERFSVPIKQGKEHACIHRVELLSAQDVGAADYVRARRQLFRFFYVADREGEP